MSAGNFFNIPYEIDIPDFLNMDVATCRDELLKYLGNRSICQKFTDRRFITPTAHNIVSTVHISTDLKKINLEHISGCMPNSVYDKRRFAAITIRLSEPKTTALLFSSGKLVVTGSVSRQMAKRAINNIVKLLRSTKLYRFVFYSRHTIQNIVCNVRLPNNVHIDMEELYRNENALCTYQPAIFPGLILRPVGSRVVLLVFKSSRIVVTGAQTYKQATDGFRDALVILNRYLSYKEVSLNFDEDPPQEEGCGDIAGKDEFELEDVEIEI